MSLTPQEQERRRSVVGASEVGLLFGLPAYGGRTLSDLWFEKKYGTEKESKGNASTALGLKLEPLVLDAAGERLGTEIIDRQQWVRVGSNAATLDGRLASTGAVVDAKTSGIIGPSHASEWGEDGTDEVPDSYLLQIQCQLLVTGADLGYVAALIGGLGFRMYPIEPQAALMKAIQIKSSEFIESLSQGQPPSEPPQLETLKRLRRQPDKLLPRSDEFEEVYERYLATSDCHKACEKDKDTLQARLIAMLGDAEAIECRGGYITYFQQTRREFFSPESKFRTMRFKKDL